jgi:hypothetical protein
MAADPSIYGMIRPMQQPEGPLDQYGKLLALKNLMRQGEMSDLSRTKLVRDLEEEEAVRRIYAGATPEQMSAPDFLQRVMGASPARGMQLQKSRLESEKTNAEIQQKRVETLGKGMRLVHERLQTVTDEPSYQAAREYAARVLGPDLMARAGMPDAYDPAFVKRALVEGKDLFTPKVQAVNLGGKEVMLDVNPFTNPRIVGMDLPRTASPEAQLTDRRERDVELAGRVAEAREGGKARADAAMALPQAQATAERGLRLIDDMLKHPGLTSAVGATWAPGARFIPGTGAADFQARFDEIKGGAFMEAFQSLRGGGQITEKEGQKATEAITRMSLSQSEVEFKKAAGELQDVIRTGLRRAQQRAGAQPGAGPSAPAAAPAAGQPAGAQRFDAPPDPAKFKGRTITDEDSGIKYQSDGTRWVRVRGASGGF